MTSGKLRPTHDTSNLHFMQATALEDNVVNAKCLSWMIPRYLAHFEELKEGACYVMTKFIKERKKPGTAAIHTACTVMSDDTLQYIMASADPGFEITQ